MQLSLTVGCYVDTPYIMYLPPHHISITALKIEQKFSSGIIHWLFGLSLLEVDEYKRCSLVSGCQIPASHLLC